MGCCLWCYRSDISGAGLVCYALPQNEEALFIKGHLFELTPVIAHIECVAA